MVRFLTVKIHYDHRELPAHNKYSRPANVEEYDEYEAPGDQGGEGFHECMNFMHREDEPVKIYLPPTAIPGDDKAGDDFVIFWCTYKADHELPARIVGVHGGATFAKNPIRGVVRRDVEHLSGLHDKWVYHATAPEELTTLFVPPLPYDVSDGRYMPVLKSWGNGRRYIDEQHAANILSDAMRDAKQRLDRAPDSEKMVVRREVEVILNLADRYGLALKSDQRTKQQKKVGGKFALPDKELGELGEKVVYERELAYAKSVGVEAVCVDWTSKQAPQSPFDIKTIRKVNGNVRDHYLEVKSSRVGELGANVFLSIYQLEKIEGYGDAGQFVFVRFDGTKVAGVDYMTVAELRERFSLNPIKFRLEPKG